MQPGVGKTLDLVDVVLGGQLARAGLREIPQGINFLEISLGKIVIEQIAVRAAGECGVRLIQDARPDTDLVERISHPGRIRRHVAPGGIHAAHARHRLGCQRHQGIGSFQIVVLQRRLVDLRIEFRLVRTVGLHRIEMLGPLGERAVENVPAAVLRRIGVVPHLAAAGEERGEGKQPSVHGKFAHRARSVAEGGFGVIRGAPL
ncbi:hypothetical protein MASR1M97_02710 [Candidatus Desulfobacillus denitrificans]